ncbi:hypothetical protein V5O48_017126 [Marasmius crinis-equi]|uniref:Reverse transcriptase Ty1/copia-type domain-containing protein n=1 Tax=Marasmius crinis-equi TaxID=585013 RepID=A0ABR3EQ27_9AGAR
MNGEPLAAIPALHINDGLTGTNSEPLYLWIIECIDEIYNIVNNGVVTTFFGLHVLRDLNERKLWITQETYIEEMLEAFGLTSDLKTQPLPLMKKIHEIPMAQPNSIPGAPTDPDQFRTWFQRIIGSLLFLSISS